jgi:hypothetical protein
MNKKASLADFLSFRRMVTPVIIKVLFWFGVCWSVFNGLAMGLGGIILGVIRLAIGGDQRGTWWEMLILGPIVGALTLVFGILFSRIGAELLILAFQVNETLTDIRNELQAR